MKSSRSLCEERSQTRRHEQEGRSRESRDGIFFLFSVCYAKEEVEDGEKVFLFQIFFLRVLLRPLSRYDEKINGTWGD